LPSLHECGVPVVAPQLPAPSQVSASRQKNVPSQLVPADATTWAGQAPVLTPSHVSGGSHVPLPARHTVPAATAVQVPSPEVAPAAVLHAWQSPATPPPHAVSQQTPSAQKPLSHWIPLVHGAPFGRSSISTAITCAVPYWLSRS
jgi:hypothetical protein